MRSQYVAKLNITLKTYGSLTHTEGHAPSFILTCTKGIDDIMSAEPPRGPREIPTWIRVTASPDPLGPLGIFAVLLAYRGTLRVRHQEVALSTRQWSWLYKCFDDDFHGYLMIETSEDGNQWK